MFKRQVFYTALLLIAIVFFGTPVCAQDDGGEKAITYGPVSSSSVFSLSTDPSNSGTSTESVNLYTGQHQESFPLVSMAGRGGNGVTMTLDYTGNVTHLAKQENFQSQASPFGLGFSLGGQRVVCDHGSTAELGDDRYQLIINGNAFELKHVEDNRFVTSPAQAWQIFRETATVGDFQIIIGWTIKMDEGTVYKLGDFDETMEECNATRYVFRYGNYVGNGVTDDDQPYPYTWDLSAIHDPEELNVTTFQYMQDLAQWQVMDENSQPVTNVHYYTRASYLQSVTMPEGSQMVIEYSDREDFQPYHEFNYDFYGTKKADKIKVVSLTGETLSVTRFTYDYISNSLSEPEFLKLILTRIDNLSGDESESVPPTVMEYFTDPDSANYGAIRRINYSSGSVKELFYSELDPAENMSALDTDLTSPYDTIVYVNGNLVLKANSAPDGSIAAAWDGYWHAVYPNNFLTYDENGQPVYINYELHEDDLPVVTPYGWMAAYSRALDKITVWKWSGGYFSIDTIDTPLERNTSQSVYLYASRDAIIAILGGYEDDSDIESKWLRRAYYFQRHDSEWESHVIYNNEEESRYLAGVQMFGSTFGLSLWYKYSSEWYNSWFIFGTYDHELNELELSESGQMDYEVLGGNFAIGPNSVCYAHFSDPLDPFYLDERYVSHLRYLGNHVWDPFPIEVDEDHDIHAMSGLPNGVTYLIPGLRSVFYSSAGWRVKYSPLATWHYLLWNAGHYLVSFDPSVTDKFQTYHWNGQVFESEASFEPSTVFDLPELEDLKVFPGSMTLFKESWDDDAWVWRYLGNSQWQTASVLDPEGVNLFLNGYAASEDFVVCDDHLAMYLPFYNGVGSQYSDFVGSWPTGYAGNCRAARDVCALVLVPSYSSLRLRKIVDTLFEGTAPIRKVDSVALYKYAGDEDPKRVRYAYYRGLVAADGVTPKFTKAEVSLPYFDSEGGPDGWSVTYYYNDSSQIAIPDGHFAETVVLPNFFEHAEDPYYGAEYRDMECGGYMLDGYPYLTYSYTTGSGLEELVDYTLYRYQIIPTVDAIDDVYQHFLVLTQSRSNGVCDSVVYTYDEFNSQLLTKKTYFRNGVELRVKTEQTRYAYNDDTDPATAAAMLADNAIIQVLDKTVTLTEDGATQTLSAIGNRFEKHGGWQPVEEFSWKDYDNRIDTLYTSRAVAFDQYGHQTSSMDINDVASCAKFNATGTRSIASAANCSDSCIIVQDFEQGTDWDGWTNWLDETFHFFDEDAFTGEFSFTLTDNTGAVEKNNWSPLREVARELLGTKVYHFSAWAKGNHTLKVFCFFRDENGDGCDSEDLEFNDLSPTEWTRIDGQFDLTDISPDADAGTMLFQWALMDEEGNPAPADAFVKLDNIRFHPLESHVSTTVYDEATELITAKLGLNNIPKRFEYDKFRRLVATKNYKNDVLSRSEYYLSDPYSPEDTSISVWASHDDYQDIDSASAVLEYPQTVSYTWTILKRFDSHDDHGIRIYINSELFYENEIDWDTIPTYFFEETYTGSFAAQAGDTISIVAYDDNSRPTRSDLTLDFVTYRGYLADDPHWIRSAGYATGDNGFDSTVSISYYNNLGELLQTRTLNYMDDGVTEAALVSGVKEHDGRGRITKDYKPYIDLIPPCGLEDITPLDEIDVEINAYYDGTNDVDCQGYPFNEVRYENDINGRIIETSLAAYDWRMDGGHTSRIEYHRDPENFQFSETSYDPDNIRSVSSRDTWERIKDNSSFYTDSDGLPAEVVKITYLNEMSDPDSSAISDGINLPYVLRRAWYSMDGFVDSSWAMDFGTARNVYDRAGNLRFFQNDKHQQEGIFVYYKYDDYGRKIEEGTVGEWLEGVSLFNQLCAGNVDFPYDGWTATPLDVAYTWTYDHHEGRVNFGKLMYTGEPDESYYKEFYYFPFEYKDSVVIKLKIAGGDQKSIVHEFDGITGQADNKTIYPYTSSAGARSVAYRYDQSGRLKHVEERSPDGSPLGYTRKFAQYEYNLGSQIKRKSIGVYDDGSEIETVQVFDYSYNPLGMLTSVNDPDAVVPYSGGIGEENPHYGMTLDYTAEGNGYYNGRVAAMRTANSTVDDRPGLHESIYSYNDLGWLTESDVTFGPSPNGNDRRYHYNFLGNRTSVDFGGTVTTYDYDPTPGSSKLIGFNSVPQTRFYDEIGNMVDDNTKMIHNIDYDYRNLMIFAEPSSGGIGPTPTELTFEYDQAGRRIYKRYDWVKAELCFDSKTLLHPGLPGAGDITIAKALIPSKPADPGGGGGGGGGEYCDVWYSLETHYLYDGGTLVMIFDQDDNVTQYYVQGKSVNVAVYPDNDDDRRAYIITDQVGSTRLMLNDVGEVVQYAFYQPFGQVMSQWTSLDDPFKFTGKEQDDHGFFDYYYFGSRYYEPSTGRFLSIDAAGQFASGYIYGLNPIIGADPDGDFFVIALIGYALTAYTVYNIVKAVVNVAEAAFYGEWKSVFQQVGMFGVGWVTGQMANGLAAGIVGKSQGVLGYTARGGLSGLLSNGASNTMGGHGFFKGGVFAGAKGAAGGLKGWDADQKKASTATDETPGEPVALEPAEAIEEVVTEIPVEQAAEQQAVEATQEEVAVIDDGQPEVGEPAPVSDQQAPVDPGRLKMSEVLVPMAEEGLAAPMPADIPVVYTSDYEFSLSYSYYAGGKGFTHDLMGNRIEWGGGARTLSLNLTIAPTEIGEALGGQDVTGFTVTGLVPLPVLSPLSVGLTFDSPFVGNGNGGWQMNLRHWKCTGVVLSTSPGFSFGMYGQKPK